MKVSNIATWLENLGLGKYQKVFAENDIDLGVLPHLTDGDLKDLGLSLGHRRKLLAAIDSEAGGNTSDARLVEDRTGVTPLPQRTAAERRQLTVMFVDLVGSTALSERLDPEDLSKVIRAYQNAVAGEITRYEGYIARYMGDGVLAYFGWPRAHEDEAEQAARAGLAVRDVVANLKTSDGQHLVCRIGIATGLVVVGELIGEGAAQEEVVVGETPNLAARLQGLAQPAQVVVAEATARLIGHTFELGELGRRNIKGFDHPVGIYAVLSERSVASRFEARSGKTFGPMEGRDLELGLLLERWVQAKSKEGQGVLLVGEAGIGKSRICRALMDVIERESPIRICYQCSPYHTESALWPVIQQLLAAAGISFDQSIGENLDKLETLLRQAPGDAMSAAPLIADLLGLDGESRYGSNELTPQAQRLRTLEALTNRLLGLAANKPVLLLVEDAHWIDPSTLELLQLVLDAVARAPVLMVLTTRPENQPELAVHPRITRLTLNRLGRAGAEAMVRRISATTLSAVVTERILDRTDGVPLFVEEMTKAVIEAGETAVPAGLHDALMARLDRISEVKEVAQIAACLGRDFDYRLLAAIADRAEAELRTALDKLAKAELIFCRGTPPHAHYIFKHALVKDAAYESLLLSKRQTVHRRIIDLCDAGQQQFSDEVMAQHCLAGGEYERAFALLMTAGQAAKARSAMEEATRHFEAAIAVLRRFPASAQKTNNALEAWLAAGTAGLVARGHMSETAVEALATAQELARQIDGREELFQATHGLYYHHQAAGRLDRARGLAQGLVQIASMIAASGYELVALRALAAVELYAGQFSRANELCTRVIERGADTSLDSVLGGYGPDPYLNASYNRTVSLLVLGYPETAITYATASLEHARSGQRPINLAACLALLTVTYFLVGQTAQARTLAAELCEVSEQHAFGMYRAIGDAFAEPDRGDQETLRRKGIPAMLREVLALMRAACSSQQDIKMSAVADLRILVSEVDRKGFGWMSAELRRMLALAHLAQDGIEAAQETLEMAIRVARSQGARWFELRACRDLARLWRDQGKCQEAHDLLYPVYDWFTEGLETADLRDAKALLEELQ